MLKSYTLGPILIFAPQRTGSSVLCEYLANIYNIPNCSEVFYNDHIYSAELKSIAANNYSFVAKIYEKDNLENTLVKNKKQYKIKLIRHNLDQQLASFYISVMNNKWSFLKNENIDDYEIKINTSVFNQEAENLLYIIDNFNKMNIDYDEILYYEDIITEINQSNFISTKSSIQPKNYQEILEYARNLLKNK